ncbi:MAG: hypothetical protein GY862_20600, partial [Gammaproteobacteria bacterium]|nr:hypothetical protein [Gammaproteobacteria bacterium]
MTNTTHNKTKTSHKSSFSGLKLSLFFLIFLLVITALPIGYDYSSSTRIADIDPVDDLNARGGKITIRYNQPVSQVNYLAGDESLRIESELSEDGLLEIHTLTAPTRFKQNYTLKKRMDIKRTVFLGLFPLPRRLNITTAAELVSMVHLVPHEDTRPLPAQLNNRIGIQFKGEAIGRYHKNVNIPPEEMDCVKITPDIKGYYQWESDSLLVFNFSEDPPAFETRYEFEVFSDKLLNPEYQEWRGEKSKAITTAGNEVYVTDFSLNGEVDWQTALRIEFSGTMASARDVLKNKSAELIPIEITPKVNGTWVWQDARTLEFQPDTASGWPAGKMVHVQIHPEINREPDRKWRAPQKEYSFTALAPEQSIRNYTLRGDKVALDDGLTVHFSRNMADTSALYKRFPNDNAESPAPFLFSPHVPGDFFWSAPDKLKFRPKDLWPELTRISVNLNPAFNPDPRYTWTGTNTFHFNTLENLIIPEFYFTPEQRIPAETFFADKASYRRNQEIPPESRLWILFDKEPERFPEGKPNSAGAVIIEPAIQGGFTWLSDSLLEFVPDDNWREHTSYTIRLSNKLLSDPRQHFPKDKAEFMFTAGKNQVFVSSMDESTLKPETALKQRPEQALTLDFSKNMNILLHAGESYPIAEVPVEKLPVFIEPPLDAVIYWQNRRQLILQPESYWQPETLYTVTLNFALLPQAEAKFTRGDRFFVRTDKNYVTVTKFSPQGETTLNTVIDVEFDRNIKPAEIKPGEEENIGLFTIQPPLAGTWVWLANNKLQFKPDEALPASSGYTAGFYPEKIEDKQFAWADTGKQVYQFYTVPLHVKQAKTRFEAAKDNFLKQRFLLDIELSAAVSKQMLRKHFSIWHKSYDDKGKLLRIPLSYTLQTGETDAAESVSAFSVESDWLDRPSQTRQIHYRIAAGLSPVQGNLNLPEDYQNFFLQESPRYIQIKKITDSSKKGISKVTLTLNAFIKPEDLRQYLQIHGVSERSALKYELNNLSSRYTDEFKYEITAAFVPGAEYLFRLEQGMLAADGAFTAKAIEKKFQQPDLDSEIAFALPGKILSRHDIAKLPVSITNSNIFSLRIEKIYANNVHYFLNNFNVSDDISTTAERIHEEEYKLTGDFVENKKINVDIDLSDLFEDNTHGLFVIRIGRYSYNDSRYFLATDIGLIARQFDKHLVIWASSLHTQDVLAGVEVKAVDRWNQIIDRSYTYSNGFARLRMNKDAVPMHVTATRGDDFSFIRIKKYEEYKGYPKDDEYHEGHAEQMDGVSSKENRMRTFIYSERQVYRPGETVHLVAVTRGREGILPERSAVVLNLYNPIGNSVVTRKSILYKAGIYIYDFK